MDNNNTMEYRIGLEKQNKRNDQVTELILDNCRASQISGLTEEFVNLETLSLINIGLVTLKGFPKLPKLKKLELSDNRLTGGLNLLHGSPKLQHLNISGNRIKDLEALEPLKEFHDLVNLDLYNCEVTKSDNYRQKVFDLLPNLHSLDGYDRNEREVADSDETDDEGSDVENRIVRSDNEFDVDDDEEDGDDDDDDDDDDDEEGSSSPYDEEYDYGNSFRVEAPNNKEDEDGDDEDDEEDDDDDDDDEDDDSNDDELAVEGQNEPTSASGDKAAHSNSKQTTKDDRKGKVENGADKNYEDDDDDDDDDDDEDDDDDDDDDDDEDDDDDDDDDELERASELRQLEKDIGEEEDSDDDDFEPTHEPDARDYEIDPEDDADADESSAHLSTSDLNASAVATASNNVTDTKQKGTKRKHEDEGGDEINES